MTYIELDGFFFGYYVHNGTLLSATSNDFIDCVLKLGRAYANQKIVEGVQR
jgi:hypothetical protein